MSNAFSLAFSSAFNSSNATASAAGYATLTATGGFVVSEQTQVSGSAILTGTLSQLAEAISAVLGEAFVDASGEVVGGVGESAVRGIATVTADITQLAIGQVSVSGVATVVSDERHILTFGSSLVGVATASAEPSALTVLSTLNGFVTVLSSTSAFGYWSASNANSFVPGVLRIGVGTGTGTPAADVYARFVSSSRLPKNAYIRHAYVQFTTDGNVGSGNVVEWSAEKRVFTYVPSSRLDVEFATLTNTSVTHTVATTITSGQIFSPPDLAPVIQELVLQSDWNENFWSVTIQGRHVSGSLLMSALSESSSLAPRLVVEYGATTEAAASTSGTATTTASVVPIAQSTVSLTASVTARPTVAWVGGSSVFGYATCVSSGAKFANFASSVSAFGQVIATGGKTTEFSSSSVECRATIISSYVVNTHFGEVAYSGRADVVANPIVFSDVTIASSWTGHSPSSEAVWRPDQITDLQLLVNSVTVPLDTCSRFSLIEYSASYQAGKSLVFSEIATPSYIEPTYQFDDLVELYVLGTKRFSGRIRVRSHAGESGNESIVYTAHGAMLLANEVSFRDVTIIPRKREVQVRVEADVDGPYFVYDSNDTEYPNLTPLTLPIAISAAFSAAGTALSTDGIPSTYSVSGVAPVVLNEDIRIAGSFTSALQSIARKQTGLKPWYFDAANSWGFVNVFAAPTLRIQPSCAVKVGNHSLEVDTTNRYTAVTVYESGNPPPEYLDLDFIEVEPAWDRSQDSVSDHWSPDLYQSWLSYSGYFRDLQAAQDEIRSQFVSVNVSGDGDLTEIEQSLDSLVSVTTLPKPEDYGQPTQEFIVEYQQVGRVFTPTGQAKVRMTGQSGYGFFVGTVVQKFLSRSGTPIIRELQDPVSAAEESAETSESVAADLAGIENSLNHPLNSQLAVVRTQSTEQTVFVMANATVVPVENGATPSYSIAESDAETEIDVIITDQPYFYETVALDSRMEFWFPKFERKTATIALNGTAATVGKLNRRKYVPVEFGQATPLNALIEALRVSSVDVRGSIPIEGPPLIQFWDLGAWVMIEDPSGEVPLNVPMLVTSYKYVFGTYGSNELTVSSDIADHIQVSR